MIDVHQTVEYARWFEGIGDRQARARILVRIRRLSLGNWGDVKSVGGGVFELRLRAGPGYRVYACRHEDAVVLLHGGVKGSQRRDIDVAKRLARGLEG